MTKLSGLMHKTLSSFRRHRGRTLFWLINGALLLLYGWTLTESVPITVAVAEEHCLAVLSDRMADIPCSGLSEGEIGLYLERIEEKDFSEVGPLDRFAPRAGWHNILVAGGDQDTQPLSVTFVEELTTWRRVGDEWRPLLPQLALRWRAPIRKTFTVQASVRRPEGEIAGIMFLEPGGQNGWIFKVNTEDRQASWWRWEDGGPSEFLLGVPFQKPLLAQTQSLLRVILRGHHGALLILIVARLLNKRLKKRPLPTPIPTFLGYRHGLILLTLFMFAAAAFIAINILEGIPHVQDSITMLFQAQLLAGGQTYGTPPEFPAFFEQEFLTVWNGRWFGQYPPGFPLVLAVGALLKIPWLFNPLLATLSLPLLYQLGKLLFSRKVGLLAAVLALFSPYYLLMSGSMMVHPAELFWTLLFLLGWIKWFQNNQGWRWLVVSGIGLGMVLLTRQVTAVAVGGSVIGLCLIASLTGRFGWKSSDRNSRSIITGGIIVALSALPFALLLLGYQWSVTGDPLQDPRLITRPFDRPGFGEDIGSANNAFIVEEIEGIPATTWYTDPDLPPRGHTLARGMFNTIQNWDTLSEHLFGWFPFLTLAFCWLLFVAGRPTFGDWLLLALMTAVISVYVSYWAAGIMYGPRYYYAALPALFLLTARGVVILGQRLGGKSGQSIAIGLTAVLIIGNLLFYLPEAISESRGFNFVSGEPLRTVQQSIEGQAIVFISGDEENWWEYGQFFSGNTPWLDGRIIYARDLGEENGRLLDLYPDRTAYCWNNLTGEISSFPCQVDS